MKIAVILGSTRKKRLGERVATWVFSHLSAMPEVEAELVDLRDYPLPFYEEEETPSSITGAYQSDVANKWFAKISEMDGFLFVTPEYNHGYPAVLKNALDYLYTPWNTKPASIVSYSSGLIGGARGVEQLRQVMCHLRLVGLPDTLHVGKAQEVLDESGNLLNEALAGILDKQLSSLVEWTKLLKQKRESAN